MTMLPEPAFTASLKFRTRLAPPATLVELSDELVEANVGAVVSELDMSHPSASKALISLAETGSRAPLGAIARKASGPKLLSQAPRSPDPLLLKFAIRDAIID